MTMYYAVATETISNIIPPFVDEYLTNCKLIYSYIIINQQCMNIYWNTKLKYSLKESFYNNLSITYINNRYRNSIISFW